MSIAGDYLKARNKSISQAANKVTADYLANRPWKKREEEEALYAAVDPVEDIAPFKQPDKRTWFESGLFGDGYDFGDITKTILGTYTDASENLWTGILGMGEKAVDAVAYVAPILPSVDKEDAAAFIAKDLYNEEALARMLTTDLVQGITGVDATKDSLLGEKADAVVQSGGQLLAQAGLQYVGVPWWVTSGLTSFGGEAEAALNEGATYGEAGVSAAITAGAEIVSEKISGGIKFGDMGTLDDVLVKDLSKGIANETVRTLSKLGLDMAGEGFEEVFSEVMGRIGQQLTYEDDQTLKEILFSKDAFDSYLESFIGGAVMGGGMSGFNAIQSKRAGVDYVTGLNEVEQKVVDAVYQSRLEEAGKDITEKQKRKIYDEVLRDMEKGGISTDTIEEILGGDNYGIYKDLLADAEEYQKLYDTESGKLSKRQQDRLAELEAINKAAPYESSLQTVRDNLSRSVYGRVKDSRLAESYNERSRRAQAFEADLSKYSGKQLEVVQNAINSGLLNNTNRTHEFVDMVAKISADKGVSFDFTNNAKLKETGFALDGKTVNGYVSGGKVTLNADAAKSLNTVVGHEITHVLEGTEFYNELQGVLFEYAKGKGDYQSRYDALTALYKDIKDANIDAELTADLVGDYLFTDTDFINRLSTEHRNVFQKIYDEIKYLYKVATAGSKEARELERVKKAFEEAYRAGGKGNNSNTKYSITADSDGKQLTEAQREYFKDSKVTDENGNLKVMYHGTPNGDFTVFREGTYFTDNKAYADRYQNPGASSIRTGKEATAPKTFAAYLNIVKPFDIGDAEARDIYINEYIKGGNALGINPHLSDAEYDKITTIDWTEGEDLRDFLIDNGYDYDGLVLDEGADGGYGDDVNYRGTSYVIFSPEQVKNIDNTTPTADPDIRYSLSDAVVDDNPEKWYNGISNLDEIGGAPYVRTGSNEDSGRRMAGIPQISGIVADGGEYPTRNIAASGIVRISPELNSAYQKSGVVPEELRDSSSDSSAFSVALNRARDADAFNGWAVTPKTEEELVGVKTFMSPNGGIGAGVTEDGDIVAVFKNRETAKGVKALHTLIPTAIDNGGTKLDCYGEKLVNNYAFYGFVPVARVPFNPEFANPGWNESKGRPDIYFMAYTGTDGADAVNRFGTHKIWTQAELDALPLFDGKDGYDNAMHYRDNLLAEMKAQETAPSLHSLSAEGETPKAYGSYNVYGKDIALETAPVAETTPPENIAPVVNESPAAENVAPTANGDLSESVAPAFRKMLKFYEMEVARDRAANPELYGNSTLTPEKAVRNFKLHIKHLMKWLNSGSPVLGGFDSPEFTEAKIAGFKDMLEYIGYTVGKTVRDAHNSTTTADIIPIKGKAITDLDKAKQMLEDLLLNYVPQPNTQATPAVETFTEAELFPDDLAPAQAELEALQQRNEELEEYFVKVAKGEVDEAGAVELNDEYYANLDRIREIEAAESERLSSIEDTDAPPEVEAPYDERVDVIPLTKKAIADIAHSVRRDLALTNRQIAEIRNVIQEYSAQEFPSYEQLYKEIEERFGLIVDEEVDIELADLQRELRGFPINVDDGIKGDIADYAQFMRSNFGKVRFSKRGRGVDSVYSELSESYPGYFPEDIINPTDQLLKIVEVANIDRRTEVEYEVDSETIAGVTDAIINAVGDFRQTQAQKSAERNRRAAFDSYMENADALAPPVEEDIAPAVTEKPPVAEKPKAAPATKPPAPIYTAPVKNGVVAGQQTVFAPQQSNRVASVLNEAPKNKRKGRKAGLMAVTNLVDKGMIFENLSLETGNMEVQAKWDYALPSKAEARAQNFMENGTNGVKPLAEIRKEVGESEQQFGDYLYHVHNIDRMTLIERFGVDNKAVFGDTVTADVSRARVRQYEAARPEFKRWAQDVYNYNRHLRKMLVDGGLITQETANLWERMYPHYVPVGRDGDTGLNVSVPLDSRKTGVNNPVKRATGGSSDILPLFNTMAQRTIQTYKAIARNSFGIELKNTLGTTIAKQGAQGVDESINTLEMPEELLKAGANGMNPTFTVFENGERVEFEINEDMFDALKPANPFWGKTFKGLNAVSNARRNLLTAWNPMFALYRNPIKDLQDVVINSQHPLKTYLSMPKAAWELATNGNFANEYFEHGGRQNTYYDSESNSFDNKESVLKKLTGVGALENAGEFIETVPRLAEFIASRNDGRSIERSMLDAARVTTNFAAGGDVTKFFNRHGVTFLNASVQGASQHIRNIREAKANGLKGTVQLVAKYAIAGLPAMLLNNLLWDDDEEYEELSDYVKDNYYVIAKGEDGKFIRIPKGRTAAVIQDCIEQIGHTLTGDGEADWGNFSKLFMDNIAPNNPLDNNILAPIGQALRNETWYGEDLVPSRLQDVPAEEQFDESTDAISKWLGEKTGLSPYKINYLLDQYSGGLGDMFLPMLTPEAESGDDSSLGNLLAPWKKEVVTDSVLNNQNVTDFYDMRDEIAVAANASDATVRDEVKAMYFDAVGWDMSDLYKEKRAIQNSDLSDAEKYEKVRELQRQIDELAAEALNGYNDVFISGNYSEVGGRRFNYDAEKGKWYEITPTNADGSANYFYEKEQEVTKGLGISSAQYWNNREEYNYAYDKPGQYAISQAVGGYLSYMDYNSAMYDIKADKDEYGNSISGSRKEKIIEYINGIDADYGQKIILFKSEYKSDDTYNYEIIDYLNSRRDISYKEMETILLELGFEVDADGNISW